MGRHLDLGGRTASWPGAHSPLSSLSASQVEYDVMDIGEPRFAEDFRQSKFVVKDLERRLASVIIQVGPAVLNGAGRASRPRVGQAGWEGTGVPASSSSKQGTTAGQLCRRAERPFQRPPRLAGL